jgi:AAA15 family ATPase/GTPase
MRVASLQIINYKSFLGSDEIPFDRLNVLVGPNNGGKSTIIRAIYLLQVRSTVQTIDIRLGADNADFILKLEDIDAKSFQGWGLDLGPEPSEGTPISP